MSGNILRFPKPNPKIISYTWRVFRKYEGGRFFLGVVSGADEHAAFESAKEFLKIQPADAHRIVLDRLE